MSKIVLATRGSLLALRQTEMTAESLRLAHPGIEIDIRIIKTRGDRIQDVPLSQVGGKGLFVKEIEEALIDGSADAAVHSLKDVPAELPPGLFLAVSPKREVPFDALVSEKYGSLDELPKGARVGTSSLRRSAMLLAVRPDLEIVSLRGNVDTRLRKLSEGLDAILLAAAGLVRLGLADRVTQLLEPPHFLPAAGQGIVAIECRENDERVRGLLAPLDDPLTHVAMSAERAFLARMGGSCQVPLAGWARVEGDLVLFDGLVGRPDGTGILRKSSVASISMAATAGDVVGMDLLELGGAAILSELMEK